MKEKNGLSALGAWMKEALRDAGMTQRELAKMMKTNEGMISKIINGRIIPSGTTMNKILNIFDAHIEIVPNK